MKLGFVTAILPELTFEDVLCFASVEGFSTVEVMCWPVGKAERKYAGVTHIDVTAMTKTRAQDILAQCGDHGVGISALGFYPNALDPNPEVARAAVAHLKKVIKAAPGSSEAKSAKILMTWAKEAKQLEESKKKKENE